MEFNSEIIQNMSLNMVDFLGTRSKKEYYDLSRELKELPEEQWYPTLRARVDEYFRLRSEPILRRESITKCSGDLSCSSQPAPASLDD